MCASKKKKKVKINKQTRRRGGGGRSDYNTTHMNREKKGLHVLSERKNGGQTDKFINEKECSFLPFLPKKKLCAFFVRKKTGIKIGKRASKSRFKRKKKLLAFCLSFFLATSSYTPSCQGNKKKENECKKEIQMENEKKRLGKKKKMARTLTCNS